MSDILTRRLRAQRLSGEPFAAMRDAVGWMGAVQSQDYPAAKWALALRTGGLTDAEADRLFDAGEVLRTHLMRPTWHFVLPGDVRWLLELTAPRVKVSMRARHRQLGIDEAVVRRSHAAIASALEVGSPLTRTELGGVLERAGVPARGEHVTHLLMLAELDALIVSGPRRDKQHTYALMDERAPRARSRQLDRDEALAELARRYFTSHGPAQLADYTWWSGLTAAEARRGVALAGPALAEEAIDGVSFWSAPGDPPPAAAGPVLHLLPNYDEFLVAYRDRTVALDPRLDTSPLPRNSVLANVVLLDGLVRCGWRRRPNGRGVAVELGPLDAAEAAAAERAVRHLERFLGLPVSIAGR